MEGESNSLAFRRLVATVAEQISEEEVRKLVYIHLYSQRNSIFRETKSTSLKLFVALEFAGTFSAARPEGLLNILEKDLKNRQLANMVKVYIRERKRKTVNIVEMNGGGVYTKPPELENDTHLRMCYKMALAQTNVLVKHLDALRDAVAKDVATPDGAAQEALENISKTGAALAKLKEKADVGFEILGSLTNRIHSNTTAEEEQGNYEDVDVPTTETDTDAVFESVDIKPPRPTSQLHKKINKTSSLPPQTTAEDSIEEEEEEDYEDVEVITTQIDAETVFEDVKPTPQVRKKINKMSSLPPPTKQKPLLKPKPAKLKLQLNTWNVSGSGFDSSRTSSMPQLDSVSEASSAVVRKISDNTESDEANDDYIDPTLLEDDEENNFEEGLYQQKNSRLLTKTISLPFFDPRQPPTVVSSSEKRIFRPLPDIPTMYKSTTEAEEEGGRQFGPYSPLETTTEDYEPIYDDIIEHTLLSRMKKPRPVSTSSSD